MDTRIKMMLWAGVAGLLAFLTIGYIANASTPFTSFEMAERQGLIEGDPDYYSSGQASDVEYAHAIMVATLRLDVKMNGCPPGSTETAYGAGALYVPNLPAKYLYYIGYRNGERAQVWGPYPAPGWGYERGYDSYGVCYAANG